jgi:hypothetical protein
MLIAHREALAIAGWVAQGWIVNCALAFATLVPF